MSNRRPVVTVYPKLKIHMTKSVLSKPNSEPDTPEFGKMLQEIQSPSPSPSKIKLQTPSNTFSISPKKCDKILDDTSSIMDSFASSEILRQFHENVYTFVGVSSETSSLVKGAKS